jgi:hypothetical protein
MIFLIPGVRDDDKVVFMGTMRSMASLFVFGLRQGRNEDGIGRPPFKRWLRRRMDTPSLSMAPVNTFFFGRPRTLEIEIILPVGFRSSQMTSLFLKSSSREISLMMVHRTLELIFTNCDLNSHNRTAMKRIRRSSSMPVLQSVILSTLRSMSALRSRSRSKNI